jgi:nitric oxide reductase large subunit
MPQTTQMSQDAADQAQDDDTAQAQDDDTAQATAVTQAQQNAAQAGGSTNMTSAWGEGEGVTAQSTAITLQQKIKDKRGELQATQPGQVEVQENRRIRAQ